MPDSELSARQRVDCFDTATTFSESCWQILDLGSYLNHPVTGWNKTVPICTGWDLDSTCCIADEPWTTCYLRLAHGKSGADCSQINAQACSYDPSLNVDPSIAPYVAYTMKNIYAINNLFTTWYLALQYASTQALSIVQDVILLIDPESQTNYILRDLLFALTCGLAYIPALSVGALSGILWATAQSGNALLKGVNNAPTVARGIWPAGTQNSQSIQIAAIENELNNATSETAAMINAGLQLLMSDMPSFVNFASTGMFSGSEPLSLPSQVDGLEMALRTYIVSGAMVANGWHAHVQFSVTRDDIATNVPGSQGFDCEWHGPNNAFCGKYIWYSDDTENAYTLTCDKNPTGDENRTMDVLEAILEKEWSTMPMLFEGAFNCSRAGNHGTPPVHIKADGVLDMSCMSQLAVSWAPGRLGVSSE